MEDSEMYSDGPKPSRRKMKSCSGQKCWDGSSGKSVDGKSKRYSLSKRSKPQTSDKKETIIIPSTHQNVRDLGGAPGDVSTYGQVNKQGTVDYGTSQRSKMKKLEVNSTKVRKFFGK